MLSFWWPALLPLLRLAGGSSEEEKGEKVIRALGESVTFQLKVSEPFTTIYCLRTKRNGATNVVALLNPGKNCATTISLPHFEGRLNVSEDCKRLQVKNLNQDDSGTYQAQIQLREKKDQLNLYFDLQVYKRLSEADLSIRCKEIGNGTRQMNCSAGPWEDGVKFGMAASDQRKVAKRTFDVQNDLEESNLNITCTAKNPVSNASRTESLKEICDAEQMAAGPTTEPDSKNENGPPPTSLAAIVVVVVVALCVIVACGVALFWWKKRKADSMQPPSSADSGGCNTIYARVGDVVEDRDSHHSQPRTQPSKQKPKMTIYTTVDHACKPNPLQTDDEKMQKGRRRAPEPKEKTIYSEITTEPQEDEDQSFKTVYETVKNPKPPKGQEYDKII